MCPDAIKLTLTISNRSEIFDMARFLRRSRSATLCGTYS